jgi:release factor glutamine methyltransferase
MPSETSIADTLRAAGCVFAEDEARLLMAAAATPDDLAAMVGRRAAGEPVEQVLGWAEFCGLRIAVEPGLFVPRRRTEFLVRLAAKLAMQAAASPDAEGPLVVVDMCCGSGAIAAALASRLAPVLGQLDVHAADVDPVAVHCARGNLAGWGGHVHEGDMYEPLPSVLRGRVGLLTANAPYVPTTEVALMPPEARLYEPPVALDGGADGLRIQRKVAAGAAAWLAPGGHLLIETSERQAPQTAALVVGAHLHARVVSSEEFSATVVVGTHQAGP